MMKCAILTDSTADLSEARAAELGIHLISLRVHFDGQVWQDHRELRSSQMLQRVAAGAAIPSSSPPDPEAYRAKIDALLQRHDHVVALHLSGRLSQTAQQAVDLTQAFGERVTVIDTWNTSVGLAMQAERARRMVSEGIPPAQVRALLGTLRPLVRTHMCLDTLSFLRKNGRIGGAAALVGGMINLKPILALQEGKVEGIARAVGGQRAFKQMAGLLTEYARMTPDGRVSFFHNGNEEAVSELQHLAAQFSLPVRFNVELGVVLSAHGGPGVYGFSFEPRTLWHEYRPYPL